ncbi:hypothetical protein AKJ42_00975 [candidate division MSBL1 archaeon SCGC-AAA261C02]|uniref:Uncharacterized protein n=1 Tax=candidate division MSBL1 archaeon SCGC-AAA261C02 TaxID=1698272 RepID=A0A133V1M0_9EURY|nr:hypothetical protein AKJ42_00975 [candidate division MSBL1 archaeon SCGC-AAA261C02]
MRLGRDFTNCLLPDYLKEEQRTALLNEELDLPSANAMVLEDYKKDVVGQLKIINKMSMNHLELDSDPPNPYLDFTEKQRKEIRETAESMDITLSLHLPYTYTGASLLFPRERPQDSGSPQSRMRRIRCGHRSKTRSNSSGENTILPSKGQILRASEERDSQELV